MLKVENVTKIFSKGNNKEFKAVDNISFEIANGEIFGLIGTNGAGKTTMMRMIATTLKPTNGKITVCGNDTVADEINTRKNIGILFGGDTGLYDRLSARENIEYFARLNNMSDEKIKSQMEKLSQAFNLDGYLDRRAGTFSRGMKQKTSFARAIVHDPQVMLFDEPSAGLDVLAAEEVIRFIKRCKQEGKTVLLSSHDMLEVEELCDRAAIIDKGKVLIEGTLAEIKTKTKCATIKDAFMKLVEGNHKEDMK